MSTRTNSKAKCSGRKRGQDGTQRQEGSKGQGPNVTIGSRQSTRINGGGSPLLFDDDIGRKISGKVPSNSASGTVSIPLDDVQKIHSIVDKYIKATNNSKTNLKKSEYINDETPDVEIKMEDLVGIFDALSSGESNFDPSPIFEVDNIKIRESLQKIMKNEKMNSEAVNQLGNWLVKQICIAFLECLLPITIFYHTGCRL